MRLNQFVTPSTCAVIVSLTMTCLGKGPDGNAVRRPKNGIVFTNQESNRLFPDGFFDTINSLTRKRHLDAHRSLEKGIRKNILALCDYLVDKRYEYGNRETAAMYLGKYGHSLAIPALLAVIRDEEDNMEVRTRAIKALGRINDKRVVMYLVEDGFGSGERRLMRHAWEALAWCLSDAPDKLKNISYIGGFRPPPGLVPREKNPPPIDPEKLDAYLDIWREWWKKNHDDVTVTRPIGVP